jgi:integral membrane protein
MMVDMKLFQEPEAWALFKTTAIGEAAGWSLLLYGIAAARYHLWGATFMLPVGGSIHGTIFLAYLGVVVAGFSSLGWTWRKATLAIFLSIVPFSTYIFEVWCEKVRREQMMGSYRRVVVRAIIEMGGKVLAVQPSTGIEWQLPGGFVALGEAAPKSLERITFELTGVSPKVGELKYLEDAVTNAKGELVMYYTITNSAEFDIKSVASHMRAVMAIDEVDYIDPRQIAATRPAAHTAVPV